MKFDNLTPYQRTILRRAARIIEGAVREQPDKYRITSPDVLRTYLMARLTSRQSEVFCVLFLDNRHKIIEFREMFQGTIGAATVHPREVVKACLEVNAAAAIFAHNHPSGVAEPSLADVEITRKLAGALDLFDIRVIDHMIIGDNCATSLAERGMLQNEA